jgi:hypothetical protein
MDQRFKVVDKRFKAVDKRFDEVDKRFDAVDRRFDQLSARLDAGFKAILQILKNKYDHHHKILDEHEDRIKDLERSASSQGASRT